MQLIFNPQEFSRRVSQKVTLRLSLPILDTVEKIQLISGKTRHAILVECIRKGLPLLKIEANQ